MEGMPTKKILRYNAARSMTSDGAFINCKRSRAATMPTTVKITPLPTLNSMDVCTVSLRSSFFLAP